MVDSTIKKEVSNEDLKKLYQDVMLCASPYKCFDEDWLSSYRYMRVVVSYIQGIRWHVEVWSESITLMPSRKTVSQHNVTLQELEKMNLMLARMADVPLTRDLLLKNMVLNVTPEGIDLVIIGSDE